MNLTDERIKKGIRQKLSDEQIARRIGRPLTEDLKKRITKLRE